jgi:hypothetical protein
MVKVICPRCKHAEEIRFYIDGKGLQQLELWTKCPKCLSPRTIIVEFREHSGKEPVQLEPKIDYKVTNYMG